MEREGATVVGVAPEVKERLEAFMADVAAGLGRSEQRRCAQLYARGLLEAGTRKSLEPVVARLGDDGDYEALQHFLADSPWDPVVVQKAVAERVAPEIDVEAWVIDDTGIPKDGKHSPGVKRQYSGTLGKIGNCQIAVSVHAVGGRGTVPLDWALYLPEEWCADAEEQLSNVVDSAMKNHQAATLSSCVVVSSSVTLIPSLNFTPSSTSPTSSWPLNRRQRCWAASSSL